MTRLRHLSILGRQLTAYAAVNRQWWLLVLVAVLTVAVALVTAGHAAAPYTLYTLF